MMRRYCLYNGQYADIAEIYEVRDGKQINIPEKLNYYRKLSKNKQLFCACGCGGVVVLVAGEKNLRKQHFRLLNDSNNSNCKYQEESDISIKSKIMLKCWLSNSLQEMEHEIKYRVPINQVTENRRKYELSIYSEDYDIGIVYCDQASNMLEEKLELLSEYMKSKVIYVTRIENEDTQGQYPEHMIRVQEAQGFCFYLNMSAKSLYKDVEAKISIYEKTHRGLWEIIDVCQGPLDDFGLFENGEIIYRGEMISDLINKRKKNFQEEQEYEIEQIKKREKAEQLRKEKECQEVEKSKKLEEEKRKHEELEKQKRNEEKKRLEAEKDEKFLLEYPKFARIFNMLKEIKSIKGEFASIQSDGKVKNYQELLEIDELAFDRKMHRIEIHDNNKKKVYIYVKENEEDKINIPRTGTLYQVIDYTNISNVEKDFTQSFSCIFRESIH